MLGLQNFPQMEETYGTNAAKSIWDLLNTRIFFRAPSGSIAEWVQKEIGEKRHKKFKDQYSYGVDIIRDGVQFSKDEINEYLVSYSDVQSLNDLECYITLPGEWPVVRMKLPWKPYREIAEGRIQREVQDVFDPDIEAALSGETSDDQTGQIVGRLFGDASTTEGSDASETASADTQSSASSDAAAPADTSSAAQDPRSGSPAQHTGGRVAALPAPTAEAVPAARDTSPDSEGADSAQRESERDLVPMDIVKHKSGDFGLDRN